MGRHPKPFTKTEVPGFARHVRFTLRSRHRQPAPAGPFGANNRSRGRVLLDQRRDGALFGKPCFAETVDKHLSPPMTATS